MDRKGIKQIIELMTENELSHFHLEREGMKIKLKKGMDADAVLEQMSALQARAPAPAAPAPAAAPAQAAPWSCPPRATPSPGPGHLLPLLVLMLVLVLGRWGWAPVAQRRRSLRI